MLVYDAKTRCHQHVKENFFLFVFSRDAEVSCIDDEFNTVDDILQGPQIKNPKSEEEKSTTDINDEIDKIVTKVNLRDTKYRLDAAEQVDVASAADVVENIKKRAKSEREDVVKRKGKGQQRSPTGLRVYWNSCLNFWPQQTVQPKHIPEP